MDYAHGAPASSMIWDHDHQVLQQALNFYNELNNRLAVDDWIELQTVLAGDAPPAGVDASEWSAIRAAHKGYQAGTAILAVLPTIAEATGDYELTVNSDLTLHIPDRLTDPALQTAMAKVLVPPPAAKSDEILAASGGMFYGRESPEHELYVQVGDHFEAGDPLYIVEVMKMFNKVYAPFAGTVDQVLVEGDGVIISKGQPIFKITPDDAARAKLIADVADALETRAASPSSAATRGSRRAATDQFLAQIA